MNLREDLELPVNFSGNWIPKEFYYIEDLNGSDREVLAMIKNLDCGEGCTASNEYLAKILNVSSRQIRNILNKLEASNLIRKEIENKTKRRMFLSDSLLSPLQKEIERIEGRKKTSMVDEKGRKETSMVDRKKTSMVDEKGRKETSHNNNSLYNKLDNNIISSDDFINQIKTEWNLLELAELKIIKGKRLEHINARLKDFTEEEFINTIRTIKQSDFLLGKNKDGWTITFDWFIKPNNFLKVMEGNYKNKSINIPVSNKKEYVSRNSPIPDFD